jgi:hypothetical protein
MASTRWVHRSPARLALHWPKWWCYNLPVGRKRTRQRAGKRSGGTLTSLRGGFRSVAHSMTEKAPSRPASRTRRILGNVVTVILLALAVGLLLRRFGLLHR